MKYRVIIGAISLFFAVVMGVTTVYFGPIVAVNVGILLLTLGAAVAVAVWSAKGGEDTTALTRRLAERAARKGPSAEPEEPEATTAPAEARPAERGERDGKLAAGQAKRITERQVKAGDDSASEGR